MMQKKVKFRQDHGKKDITVTKLVFYNVLFFAPIFAALVLANFLSGYMVTYFQANKYVLTNMLMIVFTMLIFFFIIPYIRKRENVQGVRRALVGFLVVGFSLTIPALIKGNYALPLSCLIPIANYVFLTFIYCPEVLGMDVDIGTWFEQYKQLTILFVYGGMIIFYIFGFGWIYFQMAVDGSFGPAFNIAGEEAGFGTFIYYSVIIFGTIGFGDITPITTAARFLSGFEAILALIINVIFIAILFVYVSNFREFLKKEEKAIEKAEREIHVLERKEGIREKSKAKATTKKRASRKAKKRKK